MSKRTFRMFVEEELGEFPHFVVGAILEWLLIASLFIDGFIAFLSYKFATLFQLDPPCVLCTRIDQSLAATNPSSYYNNSICESHKKDISSLAYCHVHRKLSDIRNMCDGCLISFQPDKESDSVDTKNPVHQKGSNAYKSGDQEMKLKQVKTGKVTKAKPQVEMSKCSCCGESFKKRTSSKVFVRTASNLRASLTAPAFSPRAPLTPMGWRNDDAKNAELSQMRYTELRFVSYGEPDMPEDDYGLNTDSRIKDDTKSTTTQLLPDSEELTEESLKTPSYGKGNRFFGVPLAESSVVASSPRFSSKLSKKFPTERSDLVSDLSDDTPLEGDSTLHVLKRQVRSDKRMLMVLYQELNAERNASAVAANNSMAMITRLQAEKASIEMEALQYQRMMEEQAEYDDEAIQILKDMLIQKEKDIKVMEVDLQTYTEKYGEIKKNISDQFVSEKRRSNFDNERYKISGMLNDLENLIQSSDDDGDHEDKDRGGEKKATLEKEMSIIKEKMSVMEADSGYLNNTTVTLQTGDERADLFTEIAHNLRRLRV